jgi:hypothetical protein
VMIGSSRPALNFPTKIPDAEKPVCLKWSFSDAFPPKTP